MINKSFQLLRTNPLLTTNMKVVVSSSYVLYLESFNTNSELSNIKYKHYPLYKNDYLENKIPYFYKKLPKDLAYDVKYDNDNQSIQSDFFKQFDTMYQSGAAYIEDQWYSEEFQYLAPLYIRKNSIPSGFIIMRVDDPSSYGIDVTNNLELNSMNKDNFKKEIVDKWKCVQFFNMTYESNLGVWLYNNYLNNNRFPKAPFEYNPERAEFSYWNGIDYNTGIYTSKPLFMEDRNEIETPHFRWDKFITEGFKRNDLVFPNILNLKFLFDDTPATPSSLKKYSMNRYYGFYLESLDKVCSLTSYITPDMIPNTILMNNIIVIESGLTTDCVLEDFYNVYFSGTTTYVSINPFVETWDTTKEYYIFFDNSNDLKRKKVISDLYPVKRVYQNGRWMYRIISDDIMDQYWNTGYTNIKTVTIDYNNYNIINPYIVDGTGSTTETFFIDKYRVKHSTSSMNSLVLPSTGDTVYLTGITSDIYFSVGQDVKVSYDDNTSFDATITGYTGGVFELQSIRNVIGVTAVTYSGWDIKLDGGILMHPYGDLYLIKIDEKYHVIKHYDGDSIDELQNGDFKKYYIQSDYGINLNSNYIEYWINGKNSDYYKKIYVNEPLNFPVTFPIYRIKFSDIKDFDYNIVNTGFSNFDYEKPEYVDTPEEKLYSFDYNDDAIPPTKRLGESGSGSQDKVCNLTSEYIADDELFEIYSIGNKTLITTDDGTINDVYDLSEIWRKNQSVVKWGFIGSISHSDYAYRLNNNFEVGGAFNRTTNPFLTYPDAISKNMDYFYRLGSFYSGDTSNYVYYDNQTTNIQQENYLDTVIKRFDMRSYFTLNFDYFTYYFKNKEFYKDGTYSRNFDKYSTFNGGDENVPSSTLFKGIKIKVKEVKNIYVESENGVNKIKKILYGNKEYNDYKLSIVLNENYKYITNFGIFDEKNLINTYENSINIIMNEKFKNILIVLNVAPNLIENGYNLNDVDIYDEKDGLYYGVDLSGGTGITSYYNPVLFTASNIIRAINDPNSNYGLSLNYFCIREVDDVICYGGTKMDSFDNSTMTNITNWSYSYPPFLLNLEYPVEINLSNNCYWTDPYYIDSIDNDYGATVISFDEYGSNKVTIYRHMGYYEPIFKDIEIFEGGYFYYDLDVVENKIGDGNIVSYPSEYLQDKTTNEQIFEVDLSKMCSDDFATCVVPEKKSLFNSPLLIFTFDINGNTSIENSDIITGIEFVLERYGTYNPGITETTDYSIFIKTSNQGTKENKAKSDVWDSTLGVSYGGSSDLWSIEALYGNDILNNFTVNVQFSTTNKNTSEVNPVAGIKCAKIKLWYYKSEISHPTIQETSYVNCVEMISDAGDGVTIIGTVPSPLNICGGGGSDITFKVIASQETYQSSTLSLTGFDFNVSQGAKLNGMVVNITRRALVRKEEVFCLDYIIQPIKGTTKFQNKAIGSNWGSDYFTATYGSNLDKWTNEDLLNLSIEYILDPDFTLDIKLDMINKTNESFILAAIKCVEVVVYYSLDNKDYTYRNEVYFDNNYKFDTNLTNFGKIDEIIYSKVNESKDFLNNMSEKYLIYPIIDNYGYDYSDRFIFKSSWDKEFYIRTKPTLTTF